MGLCERTGVAVLVHTGKAAHVQIVDLHHAVHPQHQLVRLQVEVDHRPAGNLVQPLQPAGGVPSDPDHPLDGEELLRGQHQLVQRHRQILRQVGRSARTQKADDVGMPSDLLRVNHTKSVVVC